MVRRRRKMRTNKCNSANSRDVAEKTKPTKVEILNKSYNLLKFEIFHWTEPPHNI